MLLWAVTVAGLGYASFLDGPVTDREQTTIDRVLPTLDAALGAVAAAVPASAGVIPALGGYRLVDEDCRITLVKPGLRYERLLELHLRPDAVPGLLDAVAAGLPAGYGAMVTHTGTVHRLVADAGNFVAVRATVGEPGQVRVVADSGCRPADRPVRMLEPIALAALRAPVDAVLGALGVEAAAWRSRRIACPGLEPLWTVEVVTRDRPAQTPARYADALAGAAGNVAPRLSGPDRLVYRGGSAAIVVGLGDSALTVTSTTGCRR